MKLKRCSVFIEPGGRQCTEPASMVRVVPGSVTTRTYYCDAHGDPHEAVNIETAARLEAFRTRSVNLCDHAWVATCDRALLGSEMAIEDYIEFLDSGEEVAS